MGDGSKIAGTVLIVVGLVMLLGQLGLPGLGAVWPFFLIIPGAGFLVRFWQTRGDSGLAFTGVLLFLLGCFFQMIEWDWISMGTHWPFFLMAPGIAFLALARVDANRRDAVVPGWILIGLALLFYLFSTGIVAAILRLIFRFLELLVKVVLPLGMIGLGAWILFWRREGGGGPRPFPEKIDPTAPGGPADPEKAAAEANSVTRSVDETARGGDEAASDGADDDGTDEDGLGATADAPPHPQIEEADFEEEEPASSDVDEDTDREDAGQGEDEERRSS